MEASNDQNQHMGEQIVLFIVATLFIGSMIRSLKVHTGLKRLNIPYSLLLITCGVLFGVTFNAFGFGELGSSFSLATSMNPRLIALILLPALLFESAFSANYHIISKELGQSLLLAFPGVFIATFGNALLCKYMFPYGWNWYESLLFGSILSATDPIAVVALLRELGASKRLALLIEAESLFNDGSAFVLYLIFLDALINHTPLGIGVVGSFLRVALGGVLWGIFMALLVLFWLTRVFNDPRVEITLTILIAYLTYWTAELQGFIGVSGVLSVVACGLTCSRYRASISPQIDASLEHVWTIISFFANTVVFVLAGFIVAIKMFGGSGAIDGRDYLLLLLLYLWLHLTRLVTILLLSPFIVKLGYGFSMKDGIVLCHAGLRGAVGLVLGLITESFTELDQTLRDKVIFHVCGIVFLTIVINGYTARYLLEWLGMDKGSPASLIVFRHAMQHMKHETTGLISALKEHQHFHGADWKEVKKLLPRYQPPVLRKLRRYPTMTHSAGQIQMERLKRPSIDKREGGLRRAISSSSLNYQNSRFGGLFNLNFTPKPREVSEEDRRKELICEIRHRFLSAQKVDYSRQYGEGMATRRVVEVLSEAADAAMDENNCSLQWKLLESHFRIPQWLRILYTSTPSWLTFLVKPILYSRLCFAVELAVAFLAAADHIDDVLKEFAELECHARGAVSQCKEESGKYKQKAVEAWMSIKVSYPEIYCEIQTRHAAQFILMCEKHSVENLHKGGILEDREAHHMTELVAQTLHFLGKAPVSTVIKEAEEVFFDISFLNCLTNEQKTYMLSHSDRTFYEQKECFIHRGEIARGLYVIIRGIVSVGYTKNFVDHSGVGTAIGAWGVLSKSTHVYSCRADSFVEAYFIPSDIIWNCALQNERSEELLWKLAASSAIKAFFMSSFTGFNSRRVSQMCSQSIYLKPESASSLTLHNPTFLLTGQSAHFHNASAPAILLPGHFSFGVDTRLLILNSVTLMPSVRKQAKRRLRLRSSHDVNPKSELGSPGIMFSPVLEARSGYGVTKPTESTPALPFSRSYSALSKLVHEEALQSYITRQVSFDEEEEDALVPSEEKICDLSPAQIYAADIITRAKTKQLHVSLDGNEPSTFSTLDNYSLGSKAYNSSSYSRSTADLASLTSPQSVPNVRPVGVLASLENGFHTPLQHRSGQQTVFQNQRQHYDDIYDADDDEVIEHVFNISPMDNENKEEVQTPDTVKPNEYLSP